MGQRICSIDGCGMPVQARGWCHKHYQRWRTTGTTDPAPPRERPTCSIEGCESPHAARGWCGNHYAQWQRRGDPTPPPLHYATPSERLAELHERTEDGCMIYTGPLNRGGYGVINTKLSQSKLAHRVAWELVHGLIPEDREIDHICRNRACINVEHLRVVTRVQNLQNHSGAPLPTNKTSGVRGVSWSKRRKKWEVTVYLDRAVVFHAFFDDLAAAGEAARDARVRFYTHNNVDRL